MAEFLTTTGISSCLEEIIKSANDQLFLISPYLKINERMKEFLEDRNRFKIDIRVIYGKNELQPDEKKWLESMDSIRTSFRRNLHAKCYLNEKMALITSMNLYEFSQINNDEMGLLVSLEKEPDLYAKILEESKRILRVSEETRGTVARVEPADSAPAPSRQPRERATVAKPQSGFCIRCKEGKFANPSQPYCGGCFVTWNRYKNSDYEEQDGYCHICGNEHRATMLKPLCVSCYRKYKDVFEFAAA